MGECRRDLRAAANTQKGWQHGGQLLRAAGAADARTLPDNGEGVVSARMQLLYDYRAPAGTRWSPTAEQLRELLALFHVGGLRTPTTAQISRITARLRAHGRIEGRNVFYWFQNQKARERKRRLQLTQDAAVPPSEATATSTSPDLPLGNSVFLQHIEPAETAQSKRFCLEPQADAQRRSSASTAEGNISNADAVHEFWPACQQYSSGQERWPLSVAERVVEDEQAMWKLRHTLQDENAGSNAASERILSITGFKQAHMNCAGRAAAHVQLAEDMHADDEKSEVSDAHVQHFTSPSARFALRSVDQMWRHHNSIGTDEADSISIVKMTQLAVKQPHAAHVETKPALNLFPLSPTSLSTDSSPESPQKRSTAHSCLDSLNLHGHHAEEKSKSLSPVSLCKQTTLLDLKLGIER